MALTNTEIRFPKVFKVQFFLRAPVAATVEDIKRVMSFELPAARNVSVEEIKDKESET